MYFLYLFFSSLQSKTEFMILLRKRYFIVFNLVCIYVHTRVSNGEGVKVRGKFEEVGFSFHYVCYWGWIQVP